MRRRLAEGSDPRRGIKISTIEKLKIRRKKVVKTAVRVEISNGRKDENWELSFARPGTMDSNCQISSNPKKSKEKQATNAEADADR